MKKLILGSSSPARKELLQRLGIPFKIISPDIKEEQLPNESAYEMAKRLAILKTQAVAKQAAGCLTETTAESLIIGCDQVICLGKQIFGKPRNHQQAVEQLTQMSGKQITSWTALCLLNTFTQNLQVSVERYDVYLRSLSPSLIEAYLQREQPYQCAGSIRAEKLGVVLFERLAGDDYSALIGLPLIRLVQFLENEKVSIL